MKTVVLGLGNPILTDDGVGIKVVRALRPLLDNPNVILGESSLGGLGLLNVLSGYDRAIIIDAIQTRGGTPGDVYRLKPSDLAPCLHLSCAHDVDFATALELGRLMGIQLPEEMSIVAIEVRDMTTFSEECTPSVRAAIGVAAEMVLSELRLLGCA